MTCLFHLVADDFTDEIAVFCFFQPCDLHVAEAVVDEGGMPPTALLALVTIADIDVGRTGIAEIVAIERAVSIEFLCIDDANGVALLSTYPDFQPTSHILANIDDSGER